MPKIQFKYDLSDHKKYVKQCYELFIQHFKGTIENTIPKGGYTTGFCHLEQNIDNHDMSKFFNVQEPGYIDKFSENHKDSLKFLYAWNHHQKYERHHPEHWICHCKHDIYYIPIPVIYIIEMMCDWSAKSMRVEAHSLYEYYYKHYNDIPLHEKTREVVDYFFDIFEFIVDIMKGKYSEEIVKITVDKYNIEAYNKVMLEYSEFMKGYTEE